MKQINIGLNNNDYFITGSPFLIQGEHLATEIIINLSVEYQGYNYIIVFQNNDNEPVVTEELIPSNNEIHYNIPNFLTQYAGKLKIELQAYEEISENNNRLIKSITVELKILKSLENANEEIPEDYMPWYLEAVRQASIATEKAREAIDAVKQVEEGLVSEGGLAGQVWGKLSDDDYDTGWVNQSGDGGSGGMSEIIVEDYDTDKSYIETKYIENGHLVIKFEEVE